MCNMQYALHKARILGSATHRPRFGNRISTVCTNIAPVPYGNKPILLQKKKSNWAKKTQLQIIENLEQAPCLNGTKKTRNMSKLGHERFTYFHSKLFQQYIHVQESVIQLALKLTFGLNITN